MNKKSGYFFEEPKFCEGDVVWFEDNKGFQMEGKIIGVETHWDINKKSYHIYTLYKNGRKRHMHIVERKIYYKYEF